MDIEEIEYRIEKIKQADKDEDDERAHAKEDELYLDFIQYVAKSSKDPELASKAKMLLETQELEFLRYCM